MTSTKTFLFLKGISRFSANLDETKDDIVQFTKDGTRNGLSNIKEIFAEILQLQMSVLYQRFKHFPVMSVSQIHMMAAKI